jgi:hypothetical protein
MWSVLGTLVGMAKCDPFWFDEVTFNLTRSVFYFSPFHLPIQIFQQFLFTILSLMIRLLLNSDATKFLGFSTRGTPRVGFGHRAQLV